MSLKLSRILSLGGAFALAGLPNVGAAQYWGDSCCCVAPVPVQQQCYRTVPVTEYREVKQVVQKPVVETKYVEQPYTEYRQVVENKTAEVPTISYQNVTEYQTVHRDCGRWVAQTQYRPQMSPCQYDGRPDLFGFLNRTGYSLRMAFTPQVWTERVYVPNVVAQQIPVNRTVAVRGTQTVNYQTARIVPVTSKRRVAVNTVRMVAEEVTVKQPVTVYRTVPSGTATVWGWGVPGIGGATATALNPSPTPDPLSATAALPKETATPITPAKPTTRRPSLDENADDFNSDSPRRIPGSIVPQSYIREIEPSADTSDAEFKHRTNRVIADEPTVASTNSESGWRARRKKVPSGPSFPDTGITVAASAKSAR
jgi:hypothetical protein